MDGLQTCGDDNACKMFMESVRGKKFLFALTISHTETCTIPGITIAGATPELAKYTPAADAEFLRYGRCISIDEIPATPDGKPTPALITRAALGMAKNMIIDAGSAHSPKTPYMHTGLLPGKNIQNFPGLGIDEAKNAIEYGKQIGESLGALADCLVLGESVPGGTTTALAVLRAFGILHVLALVFLKILDSFWMFFPGSRPVCMYGVFGLCALPASMIIFGIFAIPSAALVISAGVGLPSGVAGISSMDMHLPYRRNSASAAGVYFASSGVAPAMVIPGIVHVSVCEMVNANRNFFPLTDSINILHALSSPHVCSPSICLLSHQGYKIRLWDFTHYWICTLLITDCRGFHRAIIVPRIHD